MILLLNVEMLAMLVTARVHVHQYMTVYFFPVRKKEVSLFLVNCLSSAGSMSVTKFVDTFSAVVDGFKKKLFQIDEQERANYLYALHYYVKHPKQVLVLDETNNGRKSSMRRRCWSPCGQSPYLDCFFGSHGRRYSALCAVNINGFIPQACEVVFRENGENDLDETRGTVDKIRFTQWIVQKLIPVLGKYVLGEENSIVILDNATIHHSEEIVRLIEKAGAKIMYLPPYSLDLNPIELMFGIYKLGLKKYFYHKLSVAHTFSMQTVTRRTANNFYFHCGIPHVEKIVDDDEELEAMVSVVIAAVTSSVAVINTAAIISIKYNKKD